jgi:guanine deaminase
MKPEVMRLAVREARRGMDRNEGGPFGAVVVRGDEVVGRGHNRVLKTNDPTAHAEIIAVRRAARKLGRFDLSDCEIYATCEPCPMCLGAILWARIRHVYYGCTAEDAARVGFDDRKIYDVVRGRRGGAVQIRPLGRKECLSLFEAWRKKPDKIPY